MPPRLAKLLAALAAVGMVAAAFWIRGRGDDGGGDDGGDAVVACVTELAQECSALDGDGIEVRVEDAEVTAAALRAASSDAVPYDAWVTLGPAPAMVDAERESATRSPLFAETPPQTVAWSPMALLVDQSRAAVLADECGDPVDWDCLSAIADRPWSDVTSAPEAAAWGVVKVGTSAPTSGYGPVVLGQIAAAIADANDLPADFGANELSPEMVLQLERPFVSATQGRLPEQVDLFVTRRPEYSAVAATTGLAAGARGTQQGASLRSPAAGPDVRADVVLALLVGGDRGERVRDRVTGKTAGEAFTATGWTVGAPDGPDGLPDADVLVALTKEIG